MLLDIVSLSSSHFNIEEFFMKTNRISEEPVYLLCSSHFIVIQTKCENDQNDRFLLAASTDQCALDHWSIRSNDH